MRWLLVLAALALALQIPLAFLVAPQAANFNAPLTQRIFYYHVPAAWVAYLAFGVTAAASAWMLARNDRRADALALASAEIGLAFSVIALVTGLVWARVEFIGYSALQDPKVITLAVVIASYLAYFTLRSGIDDPERRARLAAVFGILALLGVPLSYFASRASLHPDFTRPEETLDPRLGYVLLASTLAFTLVYVALAALRYRLARLEARLEESRGTTCNPSPSPSSSSGAASPPTSSGSTTASRSSTASSASDSQARGLCVRAAKDPA